MTPKNIKKFNVVMSVKVNIFFYIVIFSSFFIFISMLFKNNQLIVIRLKQFKV